MIVSLPGKPRPVWLPLKVKNRLSTTPPTTLLEDREGTFNECKNVIHLSNSLLVSYLWMFQHVQEGRLAKKRILMTKAEEIQGWCRADGIWWLIGWVDVLLKHVPCTAEGCHKIWSELMDLGGGRPGNAATGQRGVAWSWCFYKMWNSFGNFLNLIQFLVLTKNAKQSSPSCVAQNGWGYIFIAFWWANTDVFCWCSAAPPHVLVSYCNDICRT